MKMVYPTLTRSPYESVAVDSPLALFTEQNAIRVVEIVVFSSVFASITEISEFLDIYLVKIWMYGIKCYLCIQYPKENAMIQNSHPALL